MTTTGKPTRTIIFLSVIGAAFASAAQAQPCPDGFFPDDPATPIIREGHKYEVFLAPRISWEDAKALAETKFYDPPGDIGPIQGHLATATSKPCCAPNERRQGEGFLSPF